jgi:hypothetical protein
VTRHEQLGTVRWKVSDASPPIIGAGPPAASEIAASTALVDAESGLDASAIFAGGAPSVTDPSTKVIAAASVAPASCGTTQFADWHVPAAPLHAVPSGSVVQEPSFVAPCAIVQAVQLPRHGRSQHTPSERLPLEQALADVAACPLASPHAPDPLHVEPEVQSECGSVPASEGPHIPAVPLET